MKLGRKLARLGSAGPGSRAPSAAQPAEPEACLRDDDASSAGAPGGDARGGDVLGDGMLGGDVLGGRAPRPGGHSSGGDVPGGDVPEGAPRGCHDGGAGAPSGAPGIDPARRARIRRLQRSLDALVSKGRSEMRARPSGPADAGDALAAALRSSAPTPRIPPSGRSLPGARVSTPYGPVHQVEHWLEPHHAHGVVPVTSALEAESPLVASLALDPAFREIDLSRALFIDTETTGLSTAAGTLAFLVGVAFFEDESLCVQQYLLTELGREAPMLQLLAERIRAASCVVSYNGKSFDWPLLRARYVMNRVAAPPLPPHLDLLHCARRVFKKRLDSVRLVDMERELLGFVREHDVSGAEIPGIYLHFVRSGDPGRLDGVVEHNGHDLIALAAILGELAKRFRDVRREDDPLDHLGYAKVAERAGDAERAARFASAAAAGGGDEECTLEALLLAARVARRSKDVEAEERALLTALGTRAAPRVHLELAKLYEHRRKDPVRALSHAMTTCPAEALEERERRLKRLAGRLARHNVRKRPR
ncbi:MAG TPA: ribonuclease H-like domain-containing protein [Polyangiaceae bacterium LLY-WYZ-15_(1-7)]|nr:ribonuclease H-like domain-containing protein [Polyangiaceae bacterium LLY-WYZ-15_(1-7)]HJL34995.1 ribonuclease H-like domain-containing protein [Polyangiaceae bacterium LLY-WYZ-15_(1-7)]